MEPTTLKILETAIAFAVLLLATIVIKRQILRRFVTANFGLSRKRIINKMVNTGMFILLVLTIAGIWGLEGSEILAYAASVLTVLGVAFIAQWSLLSNITSGLILYFSHPIKLGDYIEIVDKDFPLRGQVDNITLFFFHIKDLDGKVFTLSNSTIITKTIRLVDDRSTLETERAKREEEAKQKAENPGPK